MSKALKGGILLVLAGVFMLLNQLGVIPGQTFLFLLAFGFIAAYILLGARNEYGNVGFLIPGVVLLSIASFAALAERSGTGDIHPIFFFLGLGTAFLAVFLVHTYSFITLDHGERFWPIYPAAGLFLLAGIIGLGGEWAQHLGLLNYIWIVAIIAVGGWLIYSGAKRAKQE